MTRTKENVKQFIQGLFQVGVGYLKAALIFCGLDLVIVTVCLICFGVRPAWLIALGIAVLDFLPVVGAGLAFIPWIIVCVCLQKYTLALELGLLYIGLLVLRQILDPLITGKQIGLKPLVAFAAAILGVIVLGPVGLICGPLLASVVNLILEIRNKNQQTPPPAGR